MMKITEVKKQLEANKFDGLLKELYIDDDLVTKQKSRYLDLLNNFKLNFPAEEVSIYSAPGRTEVGGNHTDHQHGRVLAAAVNMDTVAIVSLNNSNIINLISEGFEISPIDLSVLDKQESEVGKSEAIIRGICSRISELNFKIGGFDAYINSEVIEGAGLSSSAAFETLIGTILSHEFNDGSISPVDIAKIGQFAENNFFDKPCGLMDQTASSVGGFITIDFNDVAKPIVEKLDFDFAKTNHSLCIVDTKGSHADLTDEYSAIPLEMKNVAKYFGKDYLREVDPVEFYQNIADLRTKVSDRSIIRAHHFFDENNRVTLQVSALRENDFNNFKSLIKDSGNSSFKYLQNVYTNIVNEQAISLALAISENVLKKQGVSRVHGGGFAGTIQAFVPDNLLKEYIKAMNDIFGENSCHVLSIRNHGGYKLV